VKAIVIMTSVILAVCILDGACAATWYVDGSIPRAGDGTSWEKAVKGIQAGINKALDGDTVIVAEGSYVENILFKGRNIILTSTEPSNWNVVAKTVIDGNQSGSVVTFYGTENETCVLSGFTIRNGTGTLGPGQSGIVLNGGGILGAQSPGAYTHATIENSIITGNSADNAGGIAYSHGMIRNNIIIGNWSLNRVNDHCGGGIGFCAGTIENNLIVGNSAACGGAISNSNAFFRNNVVVGNTSSLHGGGLAHVGTSPYTPPGGSITNCIIWGNTSPPDAQVHDSLAPSHCCIQDWTGTGTGTIALDPQFVDPDGPDNDPNTFEDNDYRLLLTSPCIDAGTNEDWMNAATDLDGKPRILLGATSLTVDIGAYELTFALQIVRNTETDVELSWTMRPVTTYTVLSSFDITAQPWTDEATFFGSKSGGPALWTDSDASSALKFYKLEIK
jgi:hypothetical protein